MRTCPICKEPHDFGVEERVPDLAQIEGARLLANEARPFLEHCGFEDSQIVHWALTYIADEGSGDLEGFLDWIDECEGAPAGV
jgi:hypothetical protein